MFQKLDFDEVFYHKWEFVRQNTKNLKLLPLKNNKHIRLSDL